MKKITLSLLALVAVLLMSCGNATVNKMEKAYEKAIAAAENATSIDELNEVSSALYLEVQALGEEAGDDVAFESAFKDVEKLAMKYYEVYNEKAAELQ